MSARKQATQHDVSTVEGFLAVYDEQAAALSREHDWCSVNYAYSTSGYANEALGGGFRIPAPGERPHSRSLGAFAVPAEWLNEAGLAARAESEAAIMAQLRTGARAAIEYGLLHGNLTVESVTPACAALGIPAPVRSTGFTTELTWDNYPVLMSDAALTADQREAIQVAMVTAVKALPGITGLARRDGEPTVYFGRSRQADGYSFPE